MSSAALRWLMVLSCVIGLGSFSVPNLSAPGGLLDTESPASPRSLESIAIMPGQAPGSLARIRTQLSGASGDGAPDGSLGKWRGASVTIGGTWNDVPDAQVGLWTLRADGEWGHWQGDLDIAVGGIFKNKGETWRAAAAGAYDRRWRTMLTNLADYWQGRSGTWHLRFAHEFNGRWVPWSVSRAEAPDFVAAWKRFRALQLAAFPEAKLVFCPNDESSRSLHLDWRRAFPGARYVDLMGVDSYNQQPFVANARQFRRKVNAIDPYGAPLGIEKHRRFAESVGLPLAIPEWSSNSKLGDGAVYMRLFSQWLDAHAGWGAGQVPYEILFNVGYFDHGVFQVYPRTKMPLAAQAYVRYF